MKEQFLGTHGSEILGKSGVQSISHRHHQEAGSFRAPAVGYKARTDAREPEVLDYMASPKQGRSAEGAVRMKRVLLVDEQPVFRDGLAALLSAGREPARIYAVEDPDAAARMLARDSFDLIISELLFRGRSDWRVLSHAAQKTPVVPVLYVSSLPTIAFEEEARRQGAAGYLSKSLPGWQMLQIITRVLGGERGYQTTGALAEQIDLSHEAKDKSAVQRLHMLMAPYRLTPREAEVLFWVARGKSNPEIAIILGSSPATVKNQVAAILQKLQVSNRVEAASWVVDKAGSV